MYVHTYCTHHPHNLAWTPPHKAKVVYPDPVSHPKSFFFFNRSSAPVCIGETPMGSPYAHMSTPTGCSYRTLRGPVTLRYTNPFGVCVPDPKGVR